MAYYFKRLLPLVLALMTIILAPMIAIAKDHAKWTILIYMVADNDLDAYAVEDFKEIARVGSTKDVNVVVQLDRAQTSSWTTTRRFRITKNLSIDAKPLMDLGEINMGDPNELKRFIQWGQNTYPAERHAVIIWNHGAGWRDIAIEKSTAKDSKPLPFKFVGSDDTNGDHLYTSELEAAFMDVKKNAYRKLEIIGFDACLMATLEVWYSLQNYANLGIASQDLEPAIGWKYDDFLEKLVADPSMNGESLSRVIIDTYVKTTGKLAKLTNTDYTLSLIDLKSINKASNSLSKLAQRLLQNYDKNHDDVEHARLNVTPFAHIPYDFWPNSVDMKRFLIKLEEKTSNLEIKKLAATSIKNIDRAILYNKSSFDSASMHGAHGVSIYFPENRSIYSKDPHSQGYKRGNTVFPVRFVDENSWSELLHSYLKKKEISDVGCEAAGKISIADSLVLLRNPFNSDPSIDQAKILQNFRYSACNHKSSNLSDLVSILRQSKQPEIDYVFALVSAIAKENRSPHHLMHLRSTAVRLHQQLGRNFTKSVMKFSNAYLTALYQYERASGDLPIPGIFVALLELTSSHEIAHLGMPMRKWLANADNYSEARASLKYLLGMKYVELATIRYKEKFLAIESFSGVKVAREYAWNRIPEFSIGEKLLAMIFDDFKDQQGDYVDQLMLDVTRSLIPIYEQCACSEKQVKVIREHLRRLEKHPKRSTNFERWKLHWSLAKALSNLSEHAEADMEFENALRYAIQEDVAFSRLYLPNIRSWSRVFPNANINLMDPNPEINFQSFFSEFHENARTGKISLKRQLWIIEMARRFSSPFNVQKGAFSSEKYVTQQIKGYDRARLRYWRSKSRANIEPLNLQWSVGRTVVYFYYSQTVQMLHAYIIVDGKVTFSSSTNLREIGIYKSISASKGSSNFTEDKDLRKLYKIIWRPIEKVIPKTLYELTIIPHHFLFEVPFAALLDKGGKRLVESYNLVHRVSLEPPLAHAQLSFKTKKHDLDVLFVVDPVSPNSQILPQLRGAFTEARSISRALGKSIRDCNGLTKKIGCISGAGATEEAFKKMVKKTRIVHFAAHGVVFADNPPMSSVVLTKTTNNDGFLTANELASALQGVELVVFSSCNLGRGPVVGDGVAGLLSSLKPSGVSRIVLSLWKVSDSVAPVLMSEFYSSLANKETVSQALQSSQKRAREFYKQALFWAPFVVYEF